MAASTKALAIGYASDEGRGQGQTCFFPASTPPNKAGAGPGPRGL